MMPDNPRQSASAKTSQKRLMTILLQSEVVKLRQKIIVEHKTCLTQPCILLKVKVQENIAGLMKAVHKSKAVLKP